MSARLQRRDNRAALLLALLALVLRLAISGFPMPIGMAGQTASLIQGLDEVPICHGGAADASSNQEPSGDPAIPAHDCALCPVCHLAAAPALLPAAAWIMTPRPAGRAGMALRPPSTGPPQHDRYAARPRGPPALRV